MKRSVAFVINDRLVAVHFGLCRHSLLMWRKWPNIVPQALGVDALHVNIWTKLRFAERSRMHQMLAQTEWFGVNICCECVVTYNVSTIDPAYELDRNIQTMNHSRISNWLTKIEEYSMQLNSSCNSMCVFHGQMVLIAYSSTRQSNRRWNRFQCFEVFWNSSVQSFSVIWNSDQIVRPALFELRVLRLMEIIYHHRLSSEKYRHYTLLAQYHVLCMHVCALVAALFNSMHINSNSECNLIAFNRLFDAFHYE